MKRLMFTICLFLCLCLASTSFGVAVNIAPDGVVFSNNVMNGYDMYKANDENTSTLAHTGGAGDFSDYILLTLPAEVNVLSIEVLGAAHNDGAVVTLLNDACDVVYTSGALTATYTDDNGGAGFEGVRYLKMNTGTGNAYLTAYEIYVYVEGVPDMSVDAGIPQTITLGDGVSLNSTVYDAKGPVTIHWSVVGAPGGDNVALRPLHDTKVTADPPTSWYGADPCAIVDGLQATGYHCNSGNSYMKVELDAVYDLATVTLYSQSSWLEGAVATVLDSSEVQIGASYTVPNGTTYTRVATNNGGAGFIGAKYVLVTHTGSYLAMHELEAWTFHVPAPVVTFTPDANAADPDASFNVPGIYVLQVDANDTVDPDASDTVTITVLAPNFAVNAGPDAVKKGLATPYKLNSSVANAKGPVTYDWSLISRPGGQNVAIGAMVDGSSVMGGYPWTNAVDDNVNTIAHTNADTGGEYIEIDMWYGYDLEKIVLYGSTSHSPDSNVIVYNSYYEKIWESGLLPQGYVYIFDNNGAGFTDAEYIRVEHKLQTYYVAIGELQAWTYHDPLPVVTFNPSANVADPEVSFNVLGSYTFQVDANDTNTVATDTVTITVESAADMNAGEDFGVISPATIPLNGSISELSAPIVYDWSYTGYMPSTSINAALTGTATQSSDPGWGGPPIKAIDDIIDIIMSGNWCHTNTSAAEWWEVDLGSAMNLAKVVFINDNNPGTHMDGSVLSVLDASRVEIWNSGAITCQSSLPYLETFVYNNGGAGFTGARYIRFDNDYYIKFTELQAWTVPSPADPTASFAPSNAVQDPTVTVSNTGLFTFELNVTATDAALEIPFDETDSVNVKVLPAGYTPFGRIVNVVASSRGGGHGGPATVAAANAAISDDGLYIATYNAPANNWVSGDATTVADQYLELELAGKYDLNYIRLWNYNATGYINKYFGVKDAIVLAKENAGDSYVQIGTISAKTYVADSGDKDQSSVFAVDTSSFANGVGFVKIDIQSNLRNQAVDTVGLSYIAFSGACTSGNIAGDIDNDCDVDMSDFAELAGGWLAEDCGYCGGLDLAGDDGNVDYADLKVITDHYLQ